MGMVGYIALCICCCYAIEEIIIKEDKSVLNVLEKWHTSKKDPESMKWEGEVTGLKICFREMAGSRASETRSLVVEPKDFWTIAPFVCIHPSNNKSK